MAVDIDNSYLTEKALDYAILSSLSYLTWDNNTGTIIYPTDMQEGERNYYNRLWQKLSDKGYTFSKYYNDPNTGYSGTIFYNSNTQQYILANRGTEASIFPWETDPNDAENKYETPKLALGFMPVIEGGEVIPLRRSLKNQNTWRWYSRKENMRRAA